MLLDLEETCIDVGKMYFAYLEKYAKSFVFLDPTLGKSELGNLGKASPNWGRVTRDVRQFFFYSNSRPPARTIQASDFCETNVQNRREKTFQVRFFLQKWA